MSELPLYIERGGGIVLKQPFTQKRTKLYAFVIDADHEALEAVCDRYLNLGGETSYRPLGPFVVLAIADIQSMRSADPEDSRKGWVGEREVAFWLPVARGKTKGGAFVAERLGWFIPYLIVDSTAAMATGREVYGFPKEVGAIAMPSAREDPMVVTVDAMVLSKFSPDTRAEVKRVLELRKRPDAEVGVLDSIWESIDGAVSELKKGMRRLFLESLTGSAPVPSLTLLSTLLDDVLHERLTLVFLKQFRDAVDSARACYQAVIEAPATTTAFRGGGHMAGPFDVSIAQHDSMPITRELGLRSGRIEPRFAVWLDFDFDVGPGIEVFRSSSG